MKIEATKCPCIRCHKLRFHYEIYYVVCTHKCLNQFILFKKQSYNMSNNMTEYPLACGASPSYARTRRRTIHNANSQARVSSTRNASKRITGPKPVSHVPPANTVWFTKGVETVKNATSMTNPKSESSAPSRDGETKLKCSWAKPLPAVVAVNTTSTTSQQWAKWSFV